MHRPIALTALAVLLAGGPGAASLCAAEPDSAEERARVQAWVTDLRSPKFLVREEATARLREAGLPAVAPLAAALSGADREFAARTVLILQQLAAEGDAACQAAAREKLESLAREPGPAAKRARTALAELDELRRRQARRELEALGARFELRETPVGALVEELLTLTLDARWTGADADLERLAWLPEVEQVVVDRVPLGLAGMRAVGRLPELRAVALKHSAPEPAALEGLAAAPRLQALALQYAEFDDRAIAALTRLQRLSSVKLYGTAVTREGAARLAAALPAAKVDWRQGGFLGVGCQADPRGCAVSLVHQGSAAARAGLQAGDIITAYNGRATPDFETLTALISENPAGREVSLSLLRGGQASEIKLVLGEWD